MQEKDVPNLHDRQEFSKKAWRSTFVAGTGYGIIE
tara:strand:- start:978 stop:1082 length:105 start_codon:yes stop_codon:yes gene_type:complete